MKKLIASLVVFGVLFTSSPANALTLSDLQKEVEILKQEIVSLKSMMSGAVLGAITSTTTYSLGMRNTEIVKFQQALIDQKYLSPGNATGVFGPLTYAAVKNFQTAKGLKADGVLGVETQASLLSMAGGPELACKIPDTWVKRKDFGGVGRQGPFGFSVGNNGYIGGGSHHTEGLLADFWEYNSTTNTWTQKADYGGGKRMEATAFSTSTKGYVGTGFWVTSTNNIRYTKDFWEYNPKLNVWTRKADFGGGERDGAVGFSIGDKGYIGTGDFKKDFWEYDIVSDEWTQKTNFGGEKRTGAVAFAIGSKGYIGMGDASPANGIVFKDFWEYNPKLDLWTKKADFGAGEGANHTGFVFDNKGYIQHGKDFQEYDPIADKWTKRANFPLPYLSTQVGFAIGKNGYVGGGNNGGTLTKDFWMYCPGIVN